MADTPEIRFTPAQAAAIGARGGSLLVSAAAGSGKTRVLVVGARERLRVERGVLDQHDRRNVRKRRDRDRVDVAHDGQPDVVRLGAAHHPTQQTAAVAAERLAVRAAALG